MKIGPSCLITGASSGLGRALALALAAPGRHLLLGGRNAARLEETASLCRERGAAAMPAAIDVTDTAAMRAWITGAGRLDLVIANAGISAHTAGLAGEEAARAIFATNLGGMLNTVLPALEVMAGQPARPEGERGRIAAINSLAAFVASPEAPAYCAAKAGADRWILAMAPIAERSAIHLTSVCPGFIRTKMTDAHDRPKPGMMSAERAASIILAGIAKNRRRIAFPYPLYLASRLVSLLPPRAAAYLITRGSRG
ncbi:MAG TPA: SDR family NAD(P)-dependent oxidoreductase [Acetobacteraceae bacterium]|nr:SDR family NAD(P)-dependent oxidoreductase [Acetobacteraceae bacterium]